jgi:NADH-quinone oxidoreductase subunit J
MLFTLLYYCFALLAIAAAIAILRTSQPFLAAIYLLTVTICMAAIYFLQGAALVAMLQLLLHAGGVLVLLLSSLLFFNPQASNTKKISDAHMLAIGGGGGLCICILGWKLHACPSSWTSASIHTVPHTAHILGYQIVGTYGLALEIVGILLLLTLIGILHVFFQNNH